MTLEERGQKPNLLERRPNLIRMRPIKFSLLMEELRGEVVGERPPSSLDEDAYLERFRWYRGMSKGFFQGTLPEEVVVLIRASFSQEEVAQRIGRLRLIGGEIRSLHRQIFKEKSQPENPYLQFDHELKNIIFYLLQGERSPCFWSDHRDSPLKDSPYQEVLFKTSILHIYLTASRKIEDGYRGRLGIDDVYRPDWHWGIYVGKKPRIRTEEELGQFLG